jgi:RNA polymerase sigma-70 factor, ECF subfamily
MGPDASLAACFQANRPHLRHVAFRILGSLDDADDAVQQTWIKASQADLRGVQNIAGWLTTVIARECFDRLRAQQRRGERCLPDEVEAAGRSVEDEVVLAEAVGRALLIVLDRLTPPERVAVVLHDTFAVPFEELGAILDRSPAAAKKLASRARRKIHDGGAPSPSRTAQQRQLARAFLAAARDGDIAGLLAVLAPDVIRRADATALPPGAPIEIRGAEDVVEETLALRRHAAGAELALVDGTVGIVVAPRGRLRLALVLTFTDERIAAYEVIADPERLDQLTIKLLESAGRDKPNQPDPPTRP